MAQNPSHPRVSVSRTDIEDEFGVQLGFLKKSCDAYDEGDTDEFRRIAVSIRVLVYDQGHSRSIIGQLGLKNISFLCFHSPIDPRNLFPSHPLVAIGLYPGKAIYQPQLDQGPPSYFHQLSFDDWWNEEVFLTPGQVSMSRSGFVLHTANQAGGAHVDPALDEGFHRIAKANEAGWVSEFGGVEKPMKDLEKACVRQIGFETLKTLEPEWNKVLAAR